MDEDIERLSESFGGYWGEHPLYPHEDWVALSQGAGGNAPPAPSLL